MVVGTLGALAGCVPAVPPVPSKGGPAWLELTSEHFTVWTDGDADRVRALLHEMETTRQVIVAAAFPSAPGNARNFVIALRDDAELTAFSPTSEPRPYARSADEPLWQPMIVMSAFSNSGLASTRSAHELTHVISASVIHYQPRWLAEGLAQYFETMRLDLDHGSADIGVAPESRGQPRALAHLVTMSTLFEWNDMTDHEDSQYSTSWAVVTFLINTHRSEFLGYLELLETEGKPRSRTTLADEERLWAKAFPSLPLTKVHEELTTWITLGRHEVFHVRLEQRSWPIAGHTLADADVYALRGMLRLFQGRPEQARNELTAALASDPTNVLGWLMTSALSPTSMSLGQARDLTQAHHADWRAWWIAAMVFESAQGYEDELTAMRTKACTLIAHNAALVVPPKLVRSPAGSPSDGCRKLLQQPGNAAAASAPAGPPH